MEDTAQFSFSDIEDHNKNIFHHDQSKAERWGKSRKLGKILGHRKNIFSNYIHTHMDIVIL